MPENLDYPISQVQKVIIKNKNIIYFLDTGFSKSVNYCSLYDDNGYRLDRKLKRVLAIKLLKVSHDYDKVGAFLCKDNLNINQFSKTPDCYLVKI